MGTVLYAQQAADGCLQLATGGPRRTCVRLVLRLGYSRSTPEVGSRRKSPHANRDAVRGDHFISFGFSWLQRTE